MKRTSRLQLLSSAVVLAALLLAGCAPSGGDTGTAPTGKAVECERTDEASEAACDLLDELVEDQSDVSADTPMAVGEFYTNYGWGAPKSIGEYTLLTTGVLADQGVACEGDPLSSWDGSSSVITEHYANSQGFESLRAAGYAYCSSLQAAGLDGTVNVGVVEVLWGTDEGEPEPESTCRSTEIIVSCFNFFRGQGQQYISAKMALTGAGVESDVATVRAFYEAYVGAFPNIH